MGQEIRTKASISESTKIIDFLYVDKERCDSFISQLCNGTLRSVTRTSGTDEGSSYSAKGSAALASGEYKHEQKSISNAAEQYDPYHWQLLELLEDLGIQPIEQLPSHCSSKLLLLNGSIAIRDAATMKSLISVITKNKNIWGKEINKQAKDVMKIVTDMLEQLPDSISFGLNFYDINIAGTLKPSGLSIQQSDLMRTYGSQLPGKWFVLGIVDEMLPAISPATDDIQSIENAIDVCSEITNQLFSTSSYKIIPVLIFRPIETT